MSETTWLKGLLARVEYTDGGDDELSMVLRELGEGSDLSSGQTGSLRLMLGGGAHLDAARLLVTALFPEGWLDMQATIGLAQAKVCFEGNRAYWSETRPTLALAVTEALLKALVVTSETLSETAKKAS